MNKRKAATPPQPVQTTPKGYEIPVPQRGDVLGALGKAAKPSKSKAEPQQPE
jgi:hypothetical protein